MKNPINKVGMVIVVEDDGPGVGVVVVEEVGVLVDVEVEVDVVTTPLDAWNSAIHPSIFNRCVDNHTLFSAIISLARMIVLLSIDKISSAAASTLMNC